MKLVITDHKTSSVISILGTTEHGDEVKLNEVMTEVFKSTRKIIIDLGGCTGINSQALGTLIEMNEICEKSGGQLVLVGIGKEISRLLYITGIRSIFNISSTLASYLYLEGDDSD